MFKFNIDNLLMVKAEANPLSLSAYLTWAEDEKQLDKKDICFPCWCNKEVRS